MSMQQIVNNSDSGLPSSSGGWAQSNSVTDCCRSPNPLSISPCQPTSPSINPAKLVRKCSVEGCDRKYVRKGYCNVHSYRLKKYNSIDLPAKSPICSVEGCGKQVSCKGVCHTHYMRLDRTGTTERKRDKPRFCSIEGCGRKHDSNGYCKAHYQRHKHNLALNIPIKHVRLKHEILSLKEQGLKQCSICKQSLPLDSFNAHKNNPDGKCERCRECTRNYHYLRQYGITLSEYNKMLVKQNGVCAICKCPPDKKRLAVDHCHSSSGDRKDSVRSLLCGACNVGLGNFRESQEYLSNAIEYLKNHAKNDFSKN